MRGSSIKQLNLFTRSRPKQLWLLNFKNPLIPRFGRDFFSQIPRTPGVYLFKNDADETLYVGKAKCLRDRVRSYTLANVENSSRKVLRMIQMARKIEWETHPDEKSALLRENHLLRELQTPFNVVNASPHTYLFAHLRLEPLGIRFHLAMQENPEYPEIYGAFKGLGTVYNAQKALYRLLWVALRECRNGFELPGPLTSRRKLEHYLFKFPEEFPQKSRQSLFSKLKRFYNGTSKALATDLIELLLKREDIAPFMNKLIQDDLELILGFYDRCAHRNRGIKRTLGLNSHILPQTRLDDFLVLVRT